MRRLGNGHGSNAGFGRDGGSLAKAAAVGIEAGLLAIGRVVSAAALAVIGASE
jgi:hypothetical protein